jgi:hypothetical protein
MDKYKVKLNRRAFRDIDSIFEYIAISRIDDDTMTVYIVTVQYQGRSL